MSLTFSRVMADACGPITLAVSITYFGQFGLQLVGMLIMEYWNNVS
jgi:hypothetical protein